MRRPAFIRRFVPSIPDTGRRSRGGWPRPRPCRDCCARWRLHHAHRVGRDRRRRRAGSHQGTCHDPALQEAHRLLPGRGSPRHLHTTAPCLPSTPSLRSGETTPSTPLSRTTRMFRSSDTATVSLAFVAGTGGCRGSSTSPATTAEGAWHPPPLHDRRPRGTGRTRAHHAADGAANTAREVEPAYGPGGVASWSGASTGSGTGSGWASP